MHVLFKNEKRMMIIFVILVSFFLTFTYLRLNVRTVDLNENKIISQINKIRNDNQLLPLIINKNLQIAAKSKAMDMKINNYFSHNSPHNLKWNDFVKNIGYHYSVAGENLAKGYITSDDVVNDWMRSQKHKDNILFEQFTETGLCIVETEDMGYIIVQFFAKPLKI
jgi:uncharacterized protein YkwD